MEIRLLGPVEAVVAGAAIRLPEGKPRALLARLALERGRVVPVETLVDDLWRAPPPSARKMLQGHVSQLRAALGADAIETRPPGYLLESPAADVDLGRFEQLTDAAAAACDAAARVEYLRRALALWRGPALAEFRDEPFALAAARRLCDLRLAALEERFETELELGPADRLVPELEALVEQEPLRERLRRQLMLALYGSGRQAEALEAYRAFRRLLVDELGIEPRPEIQELERAILRHDRSLAQHARLRPSARGVVCAAVELAPLVAPLVAEGRELLLVALASTPADLRERAERLEVLRAELDRDGLGARTACFTSTSAGADLARLAAEQDAHLVVAPFLERNEREALLRAAPCDVALAPRPDLGFAPEGPVLVPFGGGREEWAALELGAWLARAHGLSLHLLGTDATEGRRDASRMLANASLALQRFAGTPAQPVVVAPGARGVLGERGSVVVAALPTSELDPARRELVERTTLPVLLVRGGVRPGGLAPDRTLTRFSWSLAETAVGR